MPQFITVATTDELADQQAKLVEVEGQKIALFRVDSGFYALSETCNGQARCPDAAGYPSPGSRVRVIERRLEEGDSHVPKLGERLPAWHQQGPGPAQESSGVRRAALTIAQGSCSAARPS